MKVYVIVVVSTIDERNKEIIGVYSNPLLAHNAGKLAINGDSDLDYEIKDFEVDR